MPATTTPDRSNVNWIEGFSVNLAGSFYPSKRYPIDLQTKAIVHANLGLTKSRLLGIVRASFYVHFQGLLTWPIQHNLKNALNNLSAVANITQVSVLQCEQPSKRPFLPLLVAMCRPLVPPTLLLCRPSIALFQRALSTKIRPLDTKLA